MHLEKFTTRSTKLSQFSFSYLFTNTTNKHFCTMWWPSQQVFFIFFNLGVILVLLCQFNFFTWMTPAILTGMLSISGISFRFLGLVYFLISINIRRPYGSIARVYIVFSFVIIILYLFFSVLSRNSISPPLIPNISIAATMSSLKS